MASGRKRPIRRIVMVTREYGRVAGAGGVKDVCRELARALARRGRRVTVFLPAYGFIDPEAAGFVPLGAPFSVDMPYVGRYRREELRLWQRRDEGVEVVLADSRRFREKLGIYTYTAAEEEKNPAFRRGTAHYDYFAMNVLLQKAAVAAVIRLGLRPEVIHCHDGHTALIPAMLREIEWLRHPFDATGLVVTVHNAGRGYHQEVGDLPFAEAVTGLPPRIILENRLENDFDPLLAGSGYAVMNTVSENYARELMETEADRLTGWLGHRLAERGVTLHGITNGIDPEEYDPRRPERCGIAAAFSPIDGDFAGKRRCRAALVEAVAAGLPGAGAVEVTGGLAFHPSQPLFAFIGRLTGQKGVDKLIGALKSLLVMDRRFQAVVLGAGEPELAAGLAGIAADPAFRGRVCLLSGYDPVLANQVYAAADFFVMPSRYEPCGLGDYIAQLFGAVPVVHQVGGLVKVVDGVSGIGYREHSSAALMGAMIRAMELKRKDPARMDAIRVEAVRRIHARHTWDKTVRRYLSLYRMALDSRGQGRGDGGR